MDLSQEDIITIVKTVRETGYQYFKLEAEGISLTIGERPSALAVETSVKPIAEEKSSGSVRHATSVNTASDTQKDTASEEPAYDSAEATEWTITAPIVGMFYHSPSPDEPPFVQEGDVVKTGDTLGIIEVMKVFNSVASEVSGTVVKVLVEDKKGVEYGQPLFVISLDDAGQGVSDA